ncbi:MAG: AbrB/MazE/SpoVT family DNA-binding domain-containing protein [Clostridia bacterium]|nr:AbrB/MazE/SpoVT family DNA-binding domain-containing protein [Clostridia bacterium]
MKATGIVRRIDDLGRVVIPKEIRRTMKIREGTPLEIYTGVGGEVIFKKYSPVGELANFAEDYVEALSKSTEQTAAICDEDTVIAAAGPNKKELLHKNISEAMQGLIKDRVKYTGGEGVVAVDGSGLTVSAAYPIISNGDVGGAVLFVNTTGKAANEAEVKLILSATEFLGRQMED